MHSPDKREIVGSSPTYRIFIFKMIQYGMNTCIIIILHYTYGWTQDCVKSLAKHLPNKKLIVFNNNPQPKQLVLKTRGFWGKSLETNMLCQKEVQFVKNNSFVTEFVEVPRSFNQEIVQLPFHGDVLDFAFRWCSNSGYDSLMHLEPDCVAHGNKWFDDMEVLLHKGNWLVGVDYMNKNGDYVMPLCPTFWKIKPILELINSKKLTFNKYTDTINTGQKIMRECQILGKANFVSDFSSMVHYNKGSCVLHPSINFKIL